MLLSLLTRVLHFVGLPSLNDGADPSTGPWPPRPTSSDIGTEPSPGTWPPK